MSRPNNYFHIGDPNTIGKALQVETWHMYIAMKQFYFVPFQQFNPTPCLSKILLIEDGIYRQAELFVLLAHMYTHINTVFSNVISFRL